MVSLWFKSWYSLHSKSFFTSDLNILNWNKWMLEVDILILLTLLSFIALTVLRKVLICKLSIYTLKSDQWITVWWAKFELECLLLFIENLKKRRLSMSVHQNSFRRGKNTSTIPNITFTILHFAHQNTYFNCLSALESTFFYETIRTLHDCSFYSNKEKV